MKIDALPYAPPTAFDEQAGHDAAARLGDASAQMAVLVHGAGGCSPYISDLIAKEHGWLNETQVVSESAFAKILSDVRNCDVKTLPSVLRQAKRRTALLTAMADLSGVWSLQQVTSALTDFADTAVQAALSATITTEIHRGKLPGKAESDVATAGGMSVLAMGKMGAHELNYSSDIDLICLFDETQFSEDDYFEARASFVRATRRMAAMLNDYTGEGYVFRTDLRLRPDPSVTPVCMAMEAAERYYESLGRAWERAAYIKARPCAGDTLAAKRFLTTLTPFVWRKHLDFAAIQDAHDMRLRYREHKGTGGALKLDGHNLKLGRGGIRDIEFFTQTRQIIAGGRDPELRVKGTLEGLEVLARKEWITQDAAQKLSTHYVAHRTIEHRLQMLRDQQTHSLPSAAEEWARLAAFTGMSVAALQTDLTERLEEVHTLTEGFFAPDAAPPPPEHAAPEIAFDETVLTGWNAYPALRSERAAQLFARLKPEILSRLAQTARPADALLAFDGFLSGLPAGVQVFSLFDANPQLIDLLVDIVGTAPELGKHLARNAGVFDAVIAGDFFGPWPGTQALIAALSARLDAVEDYEHKLDTARRWAKEWHFGVGVHHLRGLATAEDAATRYADLAEACVAALWPHVADHFARRHGPLPGRGAVVLGMGSLGAGRLNASSDLDLIVIYDPEACETSDGPRTLPVRTYYARLTQALVTALSAPMAEGRLYEVDMRLRPSGTQGPVATSWNSFADYQRTQAWMWEHLALTRARVIAGSDSLTQDVEALRCEVISRPRARGDITGALGDMRARIAAAKSGGPWDAKVGPGRLQDIELLAQAGLLMQGAQGRGTVEGLKACAASGWIDAAQVQHMQEALALFWSVQMSLRLLSPQPLTQEDIGAQIGLGGTAFVLRGTGQPDLAHLQLALSMAAETCAGLIESALAPSGDTT